MGIGEMIGSAVGIVILAVLVVAMVRWCLQAAGDVGDALAEAIGGDIPAMPASPDDVQKLREAGLL